MPYNYVADSFHIKKLCSRLYSTELQFYTKIGRFEFFLDPFEGLRGKAR